jgi:hypothetical protein
VLLAALLSGVALAIVGVRMRNARHARSAVPVAALVVDTSR